MLPYRDSRLTRIALAVFFLAVIAYAYYEARGLLFGPAIDISTQTIAATNSAYILIQGQANHIASLMVDGNPIQVTETGAFQEPYVLARGVNRIVFDAKDAYGNATEKVIEIVYTPSATTLPAAAATTAAAAMSAQSGTSTGPIAPAR
jgi:hypothetical protein